jgi:hypothetical protein
LALRHLPIKTREPISSHCQDHNPKPFSPSPNPLCSNVLRGILTCFGLFQRLFFWRGRWSDRKTSAPG